MSRMLGRRRMIGMLCGGAGIGLLTNGCSDEAMGDPAARAWADGGSHVDDDAGVDVHDGSSPPVDAAHDSGENVECSATTSDVLGPYYLAGAPNRTRIAALEEPGDRLVITGVVFGPDCETPLAGAVVDVWQADKDGVYHGPDSEYRLRGQMMTGSDGSYEVETIMPGRYPLGEGLRPAHVHFMVSRPGHMPLTTQLYFAGDPYLPPNDLCGTGCNASAPDRIVELVGDAPMHARFDIVLAKA